MFKLVDNLTFWWPVKVTEPDPDRPGKSIDHEFEAQFEIINPDEATAAARARRAIVNDIVSDMSDDDFDAVQVRLEEHDRFSMLRVLKGWRKIGDSDGTAIPFSPETFRGVWSHRRVRQALVRAYEDAITLERGRIKN